MRNLGFKIFLAAGLLTLVLVCSVIWRQHLKQLDRSMQAEQLASTLASAVTLYLQDNDGRLPADVASLETAWGQALPRNPITGEALNLVEVMHNQQNYDISILGALPTSPPPKPGEEGKVVSPVVIVYGQPFYKGLDIDGDSLPDPVMAHWPPGAIEQEWNYVDHQNWLCESLSQVVRREEERMRAAGDRGQLDEKDKPRY